MLNLKISERTHRYWLLPVSAVVLSVGAVCFLTNLNAKELPREIAEEVSVTEEEKSQAYLSDKNVPAFRNIWMGKSWMQKIELLPDDSVIHFASIDKFARLDRIVSEIAQDASLVDVSYAWTDVSAVKSGTSALVQLAVDATGRYEIYGVLSRELGAYGLLLNDRIGGLDNWNFAYEAWLYTGNALDTPALSYEDDQLLFTYVYGQNENGNLLTKRVAVDCGYDTGHMEFLSDSNMKK